MQDALTALTLGSTYVLLAVGLSMIYGILRIIHVAHAGVYTIGAYVGYLAWGQTGSVWVALVGGMAAGALSGWLIYALMYRRLLEAPRYVPLIASIGAFIVIQDLLSKPWLMGSDRLAMQADPGLPSVGVLGATVSPEALYVLVVTAALLLALAVLFRRSDIGLQWRATASDRELAGASGVSVERAIASTFAVGSALAGAAGVTVAVYTESVFAFMGEVPSYKAFVIVVLGGLGAVLGPVVAGFVLAFAETLLIANAGFVLPRDAIAFLILVIVLIVRPQGLFGRARA
ncbi:MAG: branched-chain amino acid ABC transporter permease [Thermoleophilaceae bacterium]|nr:branched-chain amino acid ABC transporter permease [Thermoleophilaceae bacterium]